MEEAGALIESARDPVGTTKLTFLRQWTKFDNLAPEHMSSEY